MYAVLGMWEDMGVMFSIRMHAATEIALERYSPKVNAPRIP
jgi:hypothetical protein